MQPKQLTHDLSVGSQIDLADVQAIADQGFKSIICNRPDGEGPDQPSFTEIERAASAAGLSSRYLPVAIGKVSDTEAAQFKAALAALPKPVLAYCRSGTRSATLWALSQAGKRSVEDIVNRARAAGYDMSGVVSRIGVSAKA
jgi:sulfide:quinone oxidoreductase